MPWWWTRACGPRLCQHTGRRQLESSPTRSFSAPSRSWLWRGSKVKARRKLYNPYANWWRARDRPTLGWRWDTSFTQKNVRKTLNTQTSFNFKYKIMTVDVVLTNTLNSWAYNVAHPACKICFSRGPQTKTEADSVKTLFWAVLCGTLRLSPVKWVLMGFMEFKQLSNSSYFIIC